MKLLMIGGTQFIGRAVVDRVLDSGHMVAVYHRGKTEPEDMPDIPHIHGDNADIAKHLDVIKAFGPDAVIDTTQFDTPRTQAVVDALTGVIDRYVIVSSMDVYLSYGRLHRTEPGPHLEMPITEESELRTLPGFGHTEEIDNLHIERVALGQNELAVTVARLPAVFGPRDLQRRIGNLVEKLEQSGDVLKLHPINANFTWTWGYVDNIADMLIECALDRRPGNRIYNLGYLDAISVEQRFELVASALNWKGQIVVTEDGTDVPKEDQSQDLDSASSKFRHDFNYTDRIPMHEAFALTVESVKHGANPDAD
jgi:nucleoside-diphosphate-sugar epimerase